MLNLEPTDWVFVLDSSVSVGLENWSVCKKFVADCAASLGISEDGAQYVFIQRALSSLFTLFRAGFVTPFHIHYSSVAVVSFSSSPFVRVPLLGSFNATTFETALLAIPYQGRGTATARALDLVSTVVLATSNGARGKATVVLVTDGPTQESFETLQASALQLRQIAQVYAVGVGGDISPTELVEIRPSSFHQSAPLSFPPMWY